MAYLLTPFHQEIVYWQALVKQTVAQTTHLAGIFCQEPNHMGFCYTSGIVVGDIWLEPTKYGASILWIHPFPSDIAYTLLSYTNPGGVLAKSYIKLSEIVLHEYNLLASFPEVSMANPRSVSDNTLIVSWSMW